MSEKILGINTGILTNAYLLSAERIKELEKQVLENREAFAYLDENGRLCFATPFDPEAIKELAWHNAYELSTEEDNLAKKTYRKDSSASYFLKEIWQKAKVEDNWQLLQDFFPEIKATVVGVTGLTNISGALTLTDDAAGVGAYTTHTNGEFVSVDSGMVF